MFKKSKTGKNIINKTKKIGEKMYRYRRNELGCIKILVLIILILFVPISVYFIYEMYI